MAFGVTDPSHRLDIVGASKFSTEKGLSVTLGQAAVRGSGHEVQGNSQREGSSSNNDKHHRVGLIRRTIR